MDYKHLIVENLQVLLQENKAKKEVFKVKAYSKAIQQLQSHPGPIHTIEDIKGIEGIGKSMHTKIVELFETGKMHQVVEIKEANAEQQKELDAIEVLQGIAGIGPSKAHELVTQHHLLTIQDVREHEDLLNDKQKIGLKYYDDFKARIPRKEMEKHAAFLDTIIKSVNPNVIYQITGSFRRGEPSSGDIDVLLSCKEEVDCNQLLSAIVTKLQGKKYLYETLAQGEKKYMGVCKLSRHKTFRRFDLIYTAFDKFPYTLLYFTGSGDFNVQMRNYALSKGYSLSEYGLKHTKGKNKGEFIDNNADLKTEEDIFQFLGLKYVEPYARKAGAIHELD
jgi:hypothetical protein